MIFQQVIVTNYFQSEYYEEDPVHYNLQDYQIAFLPGLSIASSVNFKKSLIEKNEDIYGIMPSIVNDYLYDVSNTGYTITDPAFGPGGPGVYFY